MRTCIFHWEVQHIHRKLQQLRVCDQCLPVQHHRRYLARLVSSINGVVRGGAGRSRGHVVAIVLPASSTPAMPAQLINLVCLCHMSMSCRILACIQWPHEPQTEGPTHWTLRRAPCRDVNYACSNAIPAMCEIPSSAYKCPPSPPPAPPRVTDPVPLCESASSGQARVPALCQRRVAAVDIGGDVGRVSPAQLQAWQR